MRRLIHKYIFITCAEISKAFVWFMW